MESDKYASNKALFSDFGPLLIQSAFASISSCLFVTGAPGSGKTHTMIGRQEDPGVLPRLMEHLYLMIKQQPAPPPSYLESRLQLEVTYFEIMNEQVHDLFSQELYTQPIKVRETKDGRVFCEGLIKVKLQAMEDCEKVLATILSRVPSINPAAHTVFSMILSKVEQLATERKPSTKTWAKIQLVDIGCGDRETGSSTATARAVPSGKTSLQDKSVLGWANVMAALADNSSGRNVYIPFRQCLLTRLLQECMGGNSRNVIVGTVSPASTCYKESLNTLRSVIRAKEVTRVTANQALLAEDLYKSTYIPAAGGGWRWQYTRDAL